MATRKIYRWTGDKAFVSLTLRAKSGMEFPIRFTEGDPQKKVRARFATDNIFLQYLIEHHQLYKAGVIRIERWIDTKDEQPKEEKKEEQYKPITEVKTAQEAIDYLADNYEIAAKGNISQILQTAHQQGIDFPELKPRK